MILRVFDNLVSNAARYAKTKVTAIFLRLGETLSLTVEDDGSGFSPEGLKRAVEPYFRDQGRRAGRRTLGLGLYICRTLAERHGGSLVVGNTPEGGARVRATFKFLPLQ